MKCRVGTYVRIYLQRETPSVGVVSCYLCNDNTRVQAIIVVCVRIVSLVKCFRIVSTVVVEFCFSLQFAVIYPYNSIVCRQCKV